MLESPKYKKPPVSEALIDIRIDPLPPEKLPLIESLTSRLAANYPTKKLRYKFEGASRLRAQRSSLHLCTQVPTGFGSNQKISGG